MMVKAYKLSQYSVSPMPAGIHETLLLNKKEDGLYLGFANNILYLNSPVFSVRGWQDHHFTDGRLLILFVLDLLDVSKQFHNAEAAQYMVAKTNH